MTTKLAVPLSERVELGSPEWIAEIKQFLQNNSQAFGNLDAPFTFSARYDNPPPHLGCDVCGFSARLSRTGVDIHDTPNEDADVFFSADYNAWLPFAWTVYGGDQQIFTRTRREYTNLAGGTVGDRSGAMPDDSQLRQILYDLHDHLAVRIVNNPDIEHRIKHLGLERNIAELDETGYTVLENAFTVEFADEMRAETHRNHEGRGENASFRATMLLERGRIWEEAVAHPWVLTLADHLLGRGCLLYQSDTIVKGPGLDTHPGLHSDYGASRVEEPFPEFCLEATAVWAIDDFDADAGPTVIIPGSFKFGRQVPPGTTQKDTVTIEMPKGCIAFWHGATWHGSTPRKAPGLRTSLHNAYSRNFMRTIERYEDIDAEIINRNPPVFSTLCGLDDPFGKSGDTGADFERLRYTAKAGYGRSSLIPAEAKTA